MAINKHGQIMHCNCKRFTQNPQVQLVILHPICLKTNILQRASKSKISVFTLSFFFFLNKAKTFRWCVFSVLCWDKLKWTTCESLSSELLASCHLSKHIYRKNDLFQLAFLQCISVSELISFHSRHLWGEIASLLKLELCPADWLIVERAINFPLCLEGLAADVQIVRETGLWGDSIHGVVRKSRAPWRTAVTHAIVAVFAVLWRVIVF